MKHLIVIAALVLTGCATDVAQVLGEPLGYETRDHRIARVSTKKVLQPKDARTAEDPNGDGHVTIEEAAHYRNMTPEQYVAWQRKRTAEDYARNVKPIDCNNPRNDSQTLVCMAGALDMDLKINH